MDVIAFLELFLNVHYFICYINLNTMEVQHFCDEITKFCFSCYVSGDFVSIRAIRQAEIKREVV